MGVYVMRYQVDVYSILTNNTACEYSLRLTENGIKFKESMNSLANELSIFVPKKNTLELVSSPTDDDYFLFGDFKSLTIKKGDKVNVSMWYNTDSYMKGAGERSISSYIVNEVIINENEVEIKCLDYMFFLINTEINIAKKETSIKEIAQKMVELVNKSIKTYNKKWAVATNNRTSYFLKDAGEFAELNFNVAENVDFKLSYSSKKVNCVEILKEFESKFFLKTSIVKTYEDVFASYYTLKIGSNWLINKDESKLLKEHLFTDIPQHLLDKLGINLGFNKIINRDDLIYQLKDDVKVRIKATIHGRNNTKKQLIAGDIGGNVVTYNWNDKTDTFDEAIFQKLIDNELAKYKYTGFKQGSSFETFGYPVITPGDKVTFDGIGTLRMNHLPEDDIKDNTIFLEKSSYMVETVETTFDKNGWRQRVGISFLVPNVDDYTIISDIYKDNALGDISESQAANKLIAEMVLQQQNEALENIKKAQQRNNVK